jgi:hypothetical protein
MTGNLRRVLVPVIIIGVLAGMAGIILFGGDLFGPGKVTISSLETMQMEPPDDYNLQLMEIIKKNPDPYIRERAVFTLTDIAIRKNASEKIIFELREIALNGQDADLQSAAYANLALIDNVVPGTPQATLEISVKGTIRPGQTITVVAAVTSQRLPTKTIVGTSNIPNGLELKSPPVTAVKLVPGSPFQVPFTFTIRDPGDYKIPLHLLVSYSRVESEQIEKDLYLHVNATGGSSYIV